MQHEEEEEEEKRKRKNHPRQKPFGVEELQLVPNPSAGFMLKGVSSSAGC